MFYAYIYKGMISKVLQCILTCVLRNFKITLIWNCSNNVFSSYLAFLTYKNDLNIGNNLKENILPISFIFQFVTDAIFHNV